MKFKKHDILHTTRPDVMYRVIKAIEKNQSYILRAVKQTIETEIIFMEESQMNNFYILSI